MNSDNLQELWQQQGNEPRVSLPVIPVRNPVPVIGKIRKNMRKSLLFICIFYLFLFLLFLFLYQPPVTRPLFIVTAMILCVQTGHYLRRFYRFYRSAGHVDTSFRKSIRITILELELAIGLYKSYIFSSLPLIASLLVIIFAGNRVSACLQQFMSGNGGTISLLIFMLWLALFQLVVYFPVNGFIHFQYGRHLRELQKIWDELETEEKEIN